MVQICILQIPGNSRESCAVIAGGRQVPRAGRGRPNGEFIVVGLRRRYSLSGSASLMQQQVIKRVDQ